MCRCVKCGCKISDGLLNELGDANRYINELRYLELMRDIMAGPNLPERKSVFDMEAEELELFKKEVEEWEKKRKDI